MLELEKFNSEDFGRFRSWIRNQSDLFQFAGPLFTFPLTDEQLFNYISDSKKSPFKVRLISGEVIGHCELNFQNPVPRLARILIAGEHNRGKGLGKMLVNKMLEKLFVEREFEFADLNVYDWNKSAIRCYENVGFEINKDITSQLDNNGQVWTALNMVISKENWLKKNS